MRTLEEIKQFIVENKTGYLDANTEKEMRKGVYDKSINFLLSMLDNEEEVLFALTTTGIHSKSGIVCGGNCVLFITNERIVYGAKDFINADCKFVSLDDCLDVESSTFGIFCGNIKINTKTELIKFDFDKKQVPRVTTLINQRLKELRQSKKEAKTSPQLSGADEIIKYKQLLDAGIISAEEFELKKKQILGL